MNVEHLRSVQLSVAVATLTQAFWDYPETAHLLSTDRRRRHVLPRYLDGDCRDSLHYGSLLGITIDGQVAGAAAWLPPEAQPIPRARQLLQAALLAPALPWRLGAALEARRGQAANRARHPTEAH